MNPNSLSTALRRLWLFAFCYSCAGSPLVEKQPLQITKPEERSPTLERSLQKKPDYWTGRTDLISAPEVKPASALTLPPLKRYTLPNGLSVLLLADKRLPLIDVQLLLPVGSIDDAPDKVGLSDFVSGMLRQGTGEMNADAISEIVDSNGAHLGAKSGYETTSLYCNGRSRSLALCLRLVAALAQRAIFPEKEMEEIREKLLGSVKESRDDPATLARLHFLNQLYGDQHPAGRPMTEESLKNIRREDLLSFYKRHFVPGKAILGISGDFQLERVDALIRQHFRAWTRGQPPHRRIVPLSQTPPGLKILLVDKPDLSQAFFTLGHEGVPITHPQRDAIILMNYILGGGGFSSRLMQVVRADGGKTYGVSSRFEMDNHDGSFHITSFTRNSEFINTLMLVKKELDRLGQDPPSAEEIRLAKGDIAGGYGIRLQTASSLVDRLLQAQISGLPDTFVSEFPLRIEQLDRSIIHGVAKERISSGRLVLSIVAKADIVAPLLKAARLTYEQISYLAPISAQRRKGK